MFIFGGSGTSTKQEREAEERRKRKYELETEIRRLNDKLKDIEKEIGWAEDKVKDCRRHQSRNDMSRTEKAVYEDWKRDALRELKALKYDKEKLERKRHEKQRELDNLGGW